MRDAESREELLKKFLVRRSGLVEYQVENYVAERYSAENVDSALFNITVGCLYLTACKYSLGFDRSELNFAISETIGWYIKTNGKLYERTSHETYYQHLMLFSLAVLLEVDDIAFRGLADKWKEYEIPDALIDGLIESRFPRNQVSDSLFFPSLYGELQEFLGAEHIDIAILKKYLKAWYGRHKDCHWYNSHKAKGPAYFGYWSFEAAAVVKVMSVNCSSEELGQYFPYELLGEKSVTAENREGGQETGRVNYPGLEALSFVSLPDLKDESKERLSLISSDGKLEVAGTVFPKKGKTLAEFARAKSDSVVQQMPWYEQINDWSIFDCLPHRGLQSAYQGYWPEESESTYYLVLAIEFGDYLLSLTFTCLVKDFSSAQPIVEAFIKDIRYDN